MVFFSGCHFFNETSILEPDFTIGVTIDETEQKDKDILSVTTSSGSKGYNYLNIWNYEL